MALSRNKYPIEVVTCMITLILLLRNQPVNLEELENLRVVQEIIGDLNLKILRLEQSEGGHSIELNKQKILISAKIVELQLRVSLIVLWT